MTADHDLTDLAKQIAKEAGGSDKDVNGKPPSQATVLVQMARDQYTVHRDTAGAPFALPIDGPRLVRALRGGDDSLRAELARRYFDKHGTVPSATALADAMLTLGGYALDAAPVPVHLRVAQTDDAQWLDLGDTTGRAVRITAGGWQVVDDPPVLFRRTELTGVLPEPEPEPDGSLDPLWTVVNIPEEDRPLALALLVASLFPDIAHPIGLLLAEHGSGKTTAGKRLGGVLDPSTVGVRKPPRDEEAWVTAASGGHVIVIDNVSTIPDWLSDSLCRAVTGEGDVRRRLYTDAALQVFSFRRCLLLTTISLPALRDDLADRVVHIDLRGLEGTRRLDGALDREWAATHPRILGALLDLAAEVLRVLPNMPDEDLPRMADFYRILLAVDEVFGTKGADRYKQKAKELALDLIAGDPLLVALQQDAPFIQRTAAEVLAKLDTRYEGGLLTRPKDWPRGARALSNQLTRHAPTLRKLGWTVDKLERGGKLQALRWTIQAPADDGSDD